MAPHPLFIQALARGGGLATKFTSTVLFIYAYAPRGEAKFSEASILKDTNGHETFHFKHFENLGIFASINKNFTRSVWK